MLSPLGDIFVQRGLIIEIWGSFSGAVGVLSLARVHLCSKNYVVCGTLSELIFGSSRSAISKGYVVMELIFGSGND